MNTRSCSIGLVLLLIGSFAAAAPAAADPAHGHGYGLIKNELKAYFQELTDAGDFSGSVLVAHDGKILLRQGFGMADYENDVRNKPDTVFAIASFTKAFAAMSAMMLEERGLLTLDDTVADYVPGFPNGEQITLRHLLSQTSGLFNYTDNPDLWANVDRYHTPEEVLEYFRYDPLNFEPGSQFEYSNSNYVLVGLIVEYVSGLSFRDFVWLNILDPLGMDRTSYDPFVVDFPDKAIGYDDISVDPPVVALYIHPSVAFTAGGMFSTVEDLYKWDQALYTDRLVSFETLERILTPGLGNYGLGWYIDEMEIGGEAHKHVWHWGVYSGFHSYFSRLVDDRLTVILLLNLGAVLGTPDELEPIAETVAAIVLE